MKKKFIGTNAYNNKDHKNKMLAYFHNKSLSDNFFGFLSIRARQNETMVLFLVKSMGYYTPPKLQEQYELCSKHFGRFRRFVESLKIKSETSIVV